MNPLVALVLGFTFSFAWTPCVGPVLASVLLMASSSASAATGFALVGVYTVGFVLPFLAVGLFTGEVLRFFRTHGNVVKYTVKVGGALLIVMGVMTATGWMNGVTSYLSSFGAAPAAQEQPADQGAGGAASGDNGTGSTGGEGTGSGSASGGSSEGGSADAGAASKDGMRMAPNADLVLADQDGVEHRLSDYRGKTVFLNFFATWCGPCQREIPDIEALYRDRGENAGEVVVLGVANPKTPEHPQNSDVGVDEVKAFVDEYGITYPVLMDTTGQLFVRRELVPHHVHDRQGRVRVRLRGRHAHRRRHGQHRRPNRLRRAEVAHACRPPGGCGVFPCIPVFGLFPFPGAVLYCQQRFSAVK